MLDFEGFGVSAMILSPLFSSTLPGFLAFGHKLRLWDLCWWWQWWESVCQNLGHPARCALHFFPYQQPGEEGGGTVPPDHGSDLGHCR